MFGLDSKLQIEVRPTEIDMMGHVNNAKYLEYLEWGREKWYEEVGISFDAMREQGLGTVTVHISIDYRKEVLMGEKLTICTRPLRKGRRSFVLQQYILNEHKEKVTEAEVTIAVISLKERKAMGLPPSLERVFKNGL